MEGAKKFLQMKKFEINNCIMNIFFYRNQMRKYRKNKKFYIEEIVLMQKKMDILQESLTGFKR